MRLYTPYSSCGICAPTVLARDFTAWCVVLNKFHRLYTRNRVCTENGGQCDEFLIAYLSYMAD